MSRLLLSIILLALAGAASAAPRVVASIEPLAMVLREVLGDQAKVTTLMLPGQTPHFAAMTPAQARDLHQADLLVWLGPAAEPALAKLVARIQPPALALLDLDGVETLRGGGHDHGDHEHDIQLDPHLWLATGNMRLLAQALAAKASALGLAPVAVAEGLLQFERRLTEVSSEAGRSLAPLSQAPWLSHHHPFAYFIREFGLREPLQISDSIAGEASARRFAELAERVAAQSVSCAIAEPEARRDLLLRLCAQDCHLQPIDPLGRDQAGTSYSVFIASVAERFRQCLAED